MHSSPNEPVNTFVIPHFRHHGLARCLQTLWDRTPQNFRVIVVSQDTRPLYEELKPLVHVFVQSYRQLGFAKACNIGWRLADTPYVTLLNDDVEFVDARWWEGIMEAFKENPQAAGINPKSARQYTVGTHIESKLPYKETWLKEDYEEMLKLPYQSLQCQAMFCTVFRREISSRIGYFDEYFYPAGGEDTDWIIRAKGLRESQNRFRGYDVLSTPKSYVWHWWNQSHVDPTFVQARIQLRDKWGEDFNMSSATTQKIIPKITTRPL